jgi:hypothetical protein
MKIDASPTKEFFIDIITRDIVLLDAVKDLVDNCVDGARAIRPNDDYQGLTVDIEITRDHFVVMDNCGGISVRVARDYAFRFGRAEGAPSVDGSIGQFGVGMKRAFFKMGDAFEVISKARDSHFTLRVDVEAWKVLKDDKNRDLWEFEFVEVNEGENNPIENCGTTIEVSNLHPSVAEEFGSESFRTKLIGSLQEAHEQSMDRGLDIRVGNFALRHRMATLLTSADIKPLRIEQNFPVDQARGITAPVKLTLYAGVSDSKLEDAGWYIICNGRQVVRADKTSLTGWASVIEEVTTPKAHGQFARFRGYAVFESDDAGALPWTTQKSGVDLDSQVYLWALREMVPALRQVIDFLNALDAERDTESTRLKSILESARPVTLSAVIPATRFYYPAAQPTDSAPRTVRIQFDRDVDEVNFARDFFKVGSAKKAGERAFDYFIEKECD